MKRKFLFILFLLLCLCGNTSVSEARGYNFSFGQYQQNYLRVYSLTESCLNQLSTVVLSALSADIDDMLRSELNSDYRKLTFLLNSLHINGLSQGLIASVISTENAIEEHISAYNARIARNQRLQELENVRRILDESRQKEQENQLKDKSGTGFALNMNYLVTNYHVVEGVNIILVKGVGGDFESELLAKVAATDKAHDLAILQIIDNRFKGFGAIPYRIKRQQSDVGESIWALGYPLVAVMGDEIKFTDGKISSMSGFRGDESMYQISVPIQPGNSGGPLFDSRGNIIGITNAGLNRDYFNSENVNYAIKTSYLYHLVDSCSLPANTLPQGSAIQSVPLTQKIKTARNFVFMVLCSTDLNFHSDKLPQKVAESYVKGEGYVDLGLPSGTLWKKQNENGLLSYDEAISEYEENMPSLEQWQELRSQCRWTWQGNGYAVKGPNENTIFLPAEGLRYCSGREIKNGLYGTYWSLTPYGSDCAWYVTFDADQIRIDHINRCGGRSVRCVRK